MVEFIKRPGFIFSLVAVYAMVAFGWWTYAHFRSTEDYYNMAQDLVETQCYKATAEINDGIANDFFNDTTDIKTYIENKFPELEIIFLDPEYSINTYDKFLIRPREVTYQRLRIEEIKDKWMYGLEGGVMVLLLVWGLIWIYQSLQTRIDFNRRQNNFMLSITHELKTPLASVKLYLETLQKRALEKEKVEEILKNSVAEINRLRELVDNILLAAQLESKSYILTTSEVNASKIIEEAIQKFSMPRNLSDRLKLNIEENIFLQADTFGIETIITNLLSNAYKYSPANTPINISFTQQQDAAVLQISDCGPGISDADKKNLFLKFFRIGDEQTRKTKGTGLGLFIVKNLLNLFEAEIDVANNEHGGTTFVVTFKQ
jgi:signal transduction histidine kinase